jgi:hypothetical protein
MTAPTTMNRVIHAAVRRDLDRLDDALGRMTDGDVPRARALERAYRNLHDELHHHHVSEDTHIWPMLASVGVDRQLLDAMESEHSAMAEALAETGAAMATVAASGSRADAAAARDCCARGTSPSGTCGTRRPSSSRSWNRTTTARSGRPSRRSCAASRSRPPGASSPGSPTG